MAKADNTCSYSKANCMLRYLLNLLVIVGALNWGLVVFGFNLVEFIFGAGTLATRAVYGVVGVAAVLSAITFVKDIFTHSEAHK